MILKFTRISSSLWRKVEWRMSNWESSMSQDSSIMWSGHHLPQSRAHPQLTCSLPQNHYPSRNLKAKTVVSRTTSDFTLPCKEQWEFRFEISKQRRLSISWMGTTRLMQSLSRLKRRSWHAVQNISLIIKGPSHWQLCRLLIVEHLLLTKVSNLLLTDCRKQLHLGKRLFLQLQTAN